MRTVEGFPSVGSPLRYCINTCLMPDPRADLLNFLPAFIRRVRTTPTPSRPPPPRSSPTRWPVSSREPPPPPPLPPLARPTPANIFGSTTRATPLGGGNRGREPLLASEATNEGWRGGGWVPTPKSLYSPRNECVPIPKYVPGLPLCFSGGGTRGRGDLGGGGGAPLPDELEV